MMHTPVTQASHLQTMPRNPDKATERLFQGPLKYIQGPSAFLNAGKHLSTLGKAPFLICDSFVYKIGTWFTIS